MIFMRHIFLAALLVAAMSASARAQTDYPTKPIQLVVPVPPGGAADFIARTLGQKLGDALGQPVVISNRGGAGGTIASAGVAKAEPDGYTLLLNSITTHGIGPHLYANLSYDSQKDFLPVILVAKLPLVKVLDQGDLRKSFAEQGTDPAGGTPNEFGAFMRAESARWRDVVKQAGIKPE